MKVWAALVGLSCVILASPLVASAQAPAPPAYGQAAPAAAAKAGEGDRRMQMTETVSAADFKKIEGAPLLIAAYAVVWIVFFAALAFTFVRLRRLRADIARLEADLNRGGGA